MNGDSLVPFFLLEATYWVIQNVLGLHKGSEINSDEDSARLDRCVMYSLHKIPWWVLSFHCCQLVICIFINNAKNEPSERRSAQMN